MPEGLPLSHVYNLARLGHAGDAVNFAATPEERDALARWSGVAAVEGLSVKIDLRKLSASRFALDIAMAADVIQSCVVSLAPVPAHIERQFSRELHFAGPVRRGTKADESEPVTITDPDEDEPAEEISSLHYDLAGPVLEEYVLSLDPYPRAKGAEFGVKPAPEDRPESPFGALKSLKSSP
jgi:uncharacterized metal-binding protein YceD (DUF177 family)